MPLLALLALACGEPAAPPATSPPSPPPAVPAPPAAPAAPAVPPMPDDFCGRLKGGPHDAARAQAWALLQATEGATRCDVDGWVSDPDPKGLNVRETPTRDGAVLATLARETMVGLEGLKGSWFLVCGAQPGNPDVDGLGTVGWVHGSLLQTGTRGYDRGYVPLLVEPKDGAAEAGRVPKEAAVGLLTCHEGWLKVRHAEAEGWLSPDERCGNTFTTCP